MVWDDKMSKLKGILILILLLALIASPIAVLASDISGARYYGTIIVSNNSSATTNVAVNCTISTQVLIDGGYLNSSANNCVVRSSAGADLPFMPAVNASYPWCIWVPAIGQNAHLSDILYTANSTGGEIRYFPGVTGMTTADSASLEPGDNFTIEQKAWWDTDTGANKFAVYKPEAFWTYVSPDVSGNITSSIQSTGWQNIFPEGAYTLNNWKEYPYAEREVSGTRIRMKNDTAGENRIHEVAVWDGTAWVTPISATGATWTDIAKAYDGNTGTYALEVAGIGVWTGYLTFQIPLPVSSTKVRGWCNHAAPNVNRIEVDVGVPTATVNVTALDVSSGEHTIATFTDNISLFVGISKDNVDANFPIPDNLVLNAPLWHTESNVSPFTTKDVNEFACTVTDAAWSSDGYDFDGTGDKIATSVAFINAFKGSANGTIIIWLNVGELNRANPLFYFGDSGTSSNLHELSIEADNTVRVLNKDGADHYRGTFNPSLSADTWYQLAFTVDPTGNKLYWNSAVQTVSYTNGSAASAEFLDDLANLDACVFGRHEIAAGATFKGTEGEVQLYDRALSPTEILANYNATKWKYETSNEYFHYNLVGTGVPNVDHDWAFLLTNTVLYMEDQTISVNSTQVQYIDWEYGTTFSDNSTFGNDAAPTFRTTSSDADVSAVFTSFLPVAEARAPAYALADAPAFIETVPTIVSTWDVTPGAGTFPLAMVITAVAAATDTPPQLPLLIIATFVILACSLAMSATMRRYGSGSLIVKIIAIVAVMGVFIAIENFGIDFWMLVVFLIIAIALAMGSKQVGWQ